jgi:hypothetical protein
VTFLTLASAVFVGSFVNNAVGTGLAYALRVRRQKRENEAIAKLFIRERVTGHESLSAAIMGAVMGAQCDCSQCTAERKSKAEAMQNREN